jgi:hypothetical protein
MNEGFLIETEPQTLSLKDACTYPASGDGTNHFDAELHYFTALTRKCKRISFLVS